MNRLNRMEVDNYFKPSEIVSELFKQYPRLTLPIPLEELALASGILDVKPLGPMECEALEGMVVFEEDKESGVIFFKSHEDNIGRQRFTIAHELGHFLIRGHSAREFVCLAEDIFRKDSSVIESEANQFAAALLMPEHLLRPYTESSPNLELFKELSRLSRTSLEAFSNNFIKLYSQPLALVYTHKGKCRYVLRNDSFYKLGLSLKVSKGSDIFDPIILEGYNTCSDRFTDATPVIVDHWIQLTSSFNGTVTFKEQTYFQRNQFAVTLLVAA